MNPQLLPVKEILFPECDFIMLSTFLLSKTLESLPLKSEIRQTCPSAHSTASQRVLANKLRGEKKES